MADQRLRLAERGEDRARAMHERLRVGQITQERIALAAYLGDEAARRVMPYRDAGGVPGSWLCVNNRVLSDWTRGLAQWGQAICVRAVVAAALVALPYISRSDYAGGCPCTFLGCRRCYARRAILAAAENWLACPCEEHREACDSLGPLSDPFQAMISCIVLWGKPGTHSAGNGIAAATVALESFAILLTPGDPDIWDDPCTDTRGRDRVRQAVRDALVPWALGEGE